MRRLLGEVRVVQLRVPHRRLEMRGIASFLPVILAVVDAVLDVVDGLVLPRVHAVAGGIGSDLEKLRAPLRPGRP